MGSLPPYKRPPCKTVYQALLNTPGHEALLNTPGHEMKLSLELRMVETLALKAAMSWPPREGTEALHCSQRDPRWLNQDLLSLPARAPRNDFADSAALSLMQKQTIGARRSRPMVSIWLIGGAMV